MNIIEENGVAYIVGDEPNEGYTYWNGSSENAFRYVANPSEGWKSWAEDIHYQLPMDWDIPYV